MEREDIVLVLEWGQITRSDVLTDSVLALSLVLTSAQAQQTRQFWTVDQSMVVELLIAPCPAAEMLTLLMERKSLSMVRDEIVSMTQSVSEKLASRQSDSILPLARQVLTKIVFSDHTSSPRTRFYFLYVLSQLGKCFKENVEIPLDEATIHGLVTSDMEEVAERLEEIEAADAVSAVERAERDNVDASSLRSVNVQALVETVNFFVDAAEQRIQVTLYLYSNLACD